MAKTEWKKVDKKDVILKREDAEDICGILELVLSYIEDVGPRELRSGKEEVQRLLELLK